MKLYLYWQAQAFYMILLSMNLMKRISINKFVKSKNKVSSIIVMFLQMC
ncbi:Uncharacterised protein [Acinetobacter baumannii]|nr:Uncharacterised protein [Acinetobacter baumannii]